MFVRNSVVRTFAVCAAVALMATVAVAQPPGGGGRRGGRGPGGGGFGGFGFGGPGGPGGGMDSVALLRIEKVQEELKLDLEQGQKIQDISAAAREAQRSAFEGFRDLSDDEREKARDEMSKQREQTEDQIQAVLTDDQRARLKQISLQLRGANALLDEKVAEEVGLGAGQKEELQAAQEENMTAMREAMEAARGEGGGGFEGMREKMAELRTKADAKLLAVLTDDQAKKFEEMKGDKVDISPEDLFRGRGGRGSGAGGPGGPGGGGRRDRNRD